MAAIGQSFAAIYRRLYAQLAPSAAIHYPAAKKQNYRRDPPFCICGVSFNPIYPIIPQAQADSNTDW